MKKINITFAILAFAILLSCKPSSENRQNKPNSTLSDSLTGTFWDYNMSINERLDNVISKLTLEEKCAQLMHDAPGIKRLGIKPYNWWNEALHGVARCGKATVFPQPIGMAASFDPELIKQVANAISDEGRAKFNIAQENKNYTQYAGLTYWSPNVNIFRDPRWGRGMETWGEDPFLTGIMAGSFVKGIQGNNPKYLKAAACAKHYAVHSGPEGERHTFNALPSKKDFYETYLPAFEHLIRNDKVEAVMCAYNRTYNEPCCGNTLLMEDILRKKWGFKGHVMSDCGAIRDFYKTHKFTKTAEEAAARAIKHDVNLNCGVTYKHLIKAIEQGLITEKDINRNLKLLWRTRFKLGLFDPPEINPYNNIKEDIVNSPEHKKLARTIAQKSIVLLKNDGVLPLKKDIKTLFAIGPLAADVDAMLGNYNGISGEIVTVVEGIANHISTGTRFEYRHGFLLDRDNINKEGWAIYEARNADVTIAVIGINTLLEGEEGESIASAHKSDRIDIQLPGKQTEYLKKIKKDNNKPLIAIVLGGSPIALNEVQEIADAVIMAWYPGEQGGNAIADIIFGDISPSGKLPITFPKSVNQLPPYNDYSMIGRTYKYMKEEPLYPFGFGLSYAKMIFSNIKVDKNVLTEGDYINISAKITNSGAVTSEEVIQLYISNKDALFTVPIYDLKEIKRFNIESNSSKEVKFTLSTIDFENINDNGDKVLVKGKYKIYIGNSLPSERSFNLGAAKPVEIEIEIK